MNIFLMRIIEGEFRNEEGRLVIRQHLLKRRNGRARDNEAGHRCPIKIIEIVHSPCFKIVSGIMLKSWWGKFWGNCT